MPPDARHAEESSPTASELSEGIWASGYCALILGASPASVASIALALSTSSRRYDAHLVIASVVSEAAWHTTQGDFPIGAHRDLSATVIVTAHDGWNYAMFILSTLLTVLVVVMVFPGSTMDFAASTWFRPGLGLQ